VRYAFSAYKAFGRGLGHFAATVSPPDISPPPVRRRTFRRRPFRRHRFAAGHFAATVSPPDISPPPVRRHRFAATYSPPDQTLDPPPNYENLFIIRLLPIYFYLFSSLFKAKKKTESN
jgi:hypothetical protein